MVARVRRGVALLAAVCSVAIGKALPAQSGGLYLLMPFGARAMGQGEAVAADTTLGTEGVWWNPAALARMPRTELALHHSQTVIATSDMLVLARPSKVLGTLAASAYMVNYGDQQATDPGSNPIGTITNRNYQLAVAYATPMGKGLSAGLTYKFSMLRFQCSGNCGDQPVISGSTNALDLGAQYVLPVASPVTVGVSVRNLGPALQVKDAEQADPLPRVVQIGLRAAIPSKALAERKAALDLSADYVHAPALGGVAGGVGMTLSYDRQLFLRAGYKVQPGDEKGPTLGLGYERNGIGFDLAQRYDAVSRQSGNSSIFFTLRARF